MPADPLSRTLSLGDAIPYELGLGHLCTCCVSQCYLSRSPLPCCHLVSHSVWHGCRISNVDASSVRGLLIRYLYTLFFAREAKSLAGAAEAGAQSRATPDESRAEARARRRRTSTAGRSEQRRVDRAPPPTRDVPRVPVRVPRRDSQTRKSQSETPRVTRASTESGRRDSRDERTTLARLHG